MFHITSLHRGLSGLLLAAGLLAAGAAQAERVGA
jgi:hypothetical protein